MQESCNHEMKSSGEGREEGGGGGILQGFL